MREIGLSRVADFEALGRRWRELEERADGSFFQTWTWTGCLIEERFPDPILLEATEAGQTVALALFNRRRWWPFLDTLALGETGIAALDCAYIEYNGVLTERGQPASLQAECLHAARHLAVDGSVRTLLRPLVMSGIPEDTIRSLRARGDIVRVKRVQPTWFVDLAEPRRDGGTYLAGRSANTRQQIRRSDRSYAALGPLSVRAAASAEEGIAFLDDLRRLHQATWTLRGKPGAFAQPFFARFHRTLINRGVPRGEVDLLRVAAGDRLVGILYNLRYRGRILAYQSGFDYASADHHRKPGLTCHHQAIQYYAAAGLDCYDFLAGDDRYKRSLADQEARLVWAEAISAWSPRRFVGGVRSA